VFTKPEYDPVTRALLLRPHRRKELIDQYSRLSEEAARRERRALWQVQRMRLDEARAQFFMHDAQQTQVCIELTLESHTHTHTQDNVFILIT